MDAPSWTDILQTVAIVAALCFTGLEIRARVREQRFSRYSEAITGSVDIAKLAVESRDLHALYEYSSLDWAAAHYAELSPSQKALVLYCDLIIALCETVWLADSRGYLSPDEWPYWQRWSQELNGSPAFRWTLAWVALDYDPEFLHALHPVSQSGRA